MHVLFATAELAPLVKVGGLGEAACGLVRALRLQGHHVDVVLPDYGIGGHQHSPLHPSGHEPVITLDVPSWAAPAVVRTIELPELGPVHLVDTPGIRRHHPYVHTATGQGWADNDLRFFGFSRAVAALAARWRPDVVHLNDWHTATALAALEPTMPTVFTVHNLAYQGWADAGWATALGDRGTPFMHHDAINPLAGALRLAHAVVAVSPTYAREIRTAEHGEGLHPLTVACGERLIGIRNGIDHARWNPATDVSLAANYHASDVAGREVCAKELRRRVGFDHTARNGADGADGPIIAVVARLVEQKGIDLALALAPLLQTLPARLVVVGDGDPALADAARQQMVRHPDRVWFAPYRDELAHQVAAGADIMLVPSRFEPCGVTQMEAMAYGAVPVVSAVGGLRDTVVDADRYPSRGNGFVAATADPLHLMDAVHRAVRAHRNRRRWQTIQSRGMRTDWSWDG
ncbi:MAG: glycogen synthase, partial [Acidimicrobiales bacterium]